jgi:hypothetical protein
MVKALNYPRSFAKMLAIEGNMIEKYFNIFKIGMTDCCH